MARQLAAKAIRRLLLVSIHVLGAVAFAGASAGRRSAVRPSEITQQVPAVFVFGDSTMDVGNNNYLSGENVPRANKPYYGVDYPTSRPTGRFSNGYNVADFIAKALGFNESPPAYLSLAPERSNSLVVAAVSRGVSYASAGAGILDSTDLYKGGARKFAIINVGPLGCVPVVRLLSGTGGCDDDLNQMAIGLDDAIKPMLTGLTSRLHGLVYSLGNFYDQAMDNFAHPKAFGRDRHPPHHQSHPLVPPTSGAYTTRPCHRWTCKHDNRLVMAGNLLGIGGDDLARFGRKQIKEEGGELSQRTVVPALARACV